MSAEITLTDHNDATSNDVTVTIEYSDGTKTFHLRGDLRTYVKQRLLLLCEELGVQV